MESLVTSLLVAILFYGMFYFLTVKPIEEIKFQVEEVLRGKKANLESKLLFEELLPVRHSINSILSRLRELTNQDSGEVRELEEDGPYLRTMEQFLVGAQGPVMILDSEKKIKKLNAEAEDLIGIRESASIDASLLDTARDQGFAATVIDLCDKAASNDGANQSEVYEIQGKKMQVHVSPLMGRDKFAKCFYITFVADR
jgi:nitrogen fixation/metabolism regulation signal transduction histidine kinase